MEDVKIGLCCVTIYDKSTTMIFYWTNIIQEENIKQISYLHKKVNKNLQPIFYFPGRIPDIQDFPGTGNQNHVNL